MRDELYGGHAAPGVTGRPSGPACALALGAILCVGLPAQAPEWREVATWPPRMFHAMAYDLHRGRVVVFGGRLYADTWEWDGERWVRRFPRHAPPWRESHAMAYDPISRRVILFGGVRVGSILGDTWAWDGRDWTRLNPTTSPKPRAEHRMATDLGRGELVLFGGILAAGRFGREIAAKDTWVWDGKSWVQRFPQTVPTERWGHAMAFCPKSGRVVMFGGVYRFVPSRGTWEWDGRNWILRSPATTPRLRTRHGMAIDPGNGNVLLHGGDLFTTIGRENQETWSWDGRNWTLLSPKTVPPKRRWPYLAPDLVHRRVVMLGRRGIDLSPLQTWVYSNGDWRLAVRPTAPVEMEGAAYDAARDQVVVVGPSVPQSRTAPLETLVMEDERFVRLRPATQPPMRRDFAMLYHPRLRRVLLYGGGDEFGPPPYGRFNDLWAWDGTTWREIKSSTAPRPEIRPRLVYDSRRDKVVLFSRWGETWEWDPRGWTRRHPRTSPSPRWDFAFAYDAARGRAVLYGGLTDKRTYDETWEWDGRDWTLRKPLSRLPFGANEYTMAYHPELGGVVAFSCLHAWAWVWDGTTWRRIGGVFPSVRCGTTAYPVPLTKAAFYDSGRQRLRVMLAEPSGPFFGAWDLVVPNLTVDQPLPRLGERITFTAMLPGHAGRTFLLGLALGNRPGVPLLRVPYVGTELLPLRPGPLLSASVQAGLGGRLDPRGRTTVSLAIPNDPSLLWRSFHAAGVAFDPNGPSIRAVTDGVPMEIVR